MKSGERNKLCPNCDGRIPYDTFQCPYCFAMQQPTEENVTPLYTPPHQHSRDLNSFALYPDKSSPPSSSQSKEQEKRQPAFLKAIFCVIFGGHLLTLGLLQFLFANEGTLSLEINGRYWFLTTLFSLPLLYYGFKTVSSKEEYDD